MSDAEWHLHWVTVQEFARIIGKDPRIVRYWIIDGTITQLGFPIYRICHGRFNTRSFIFI